MHLRTDGHGSLIGTSRGGLDQPEEIHGIKLQRHGAELLDLIGTSRGGLDPEEIHGIKLQQGGSESGDFVDFVGLQLENQGRSHNGVNGVARPLGSHGNNLRGPLELLVRPLGAAGATSWSCTPRVR
ncbi:hypothetical protein DVH24_032321 [Malus domestica]|uniref:Uncharacterized protein n=1 Tax=Malus domestica TaxID=3750 RepID=A0A498J6Z6_MALDO|nr:hypothetical protein DVH24_032321 [Malus domestica]